MYHLTGSTLVTMTTRQWMKTPHQAAAHVAAHFMQQVQRKEHKEQEDQEQEEQEGQEQVHCLGDSILTR